MMQNSNPCDYNRYSTPLQNINVAYSPSLNNTNREWHKITQRIHMEPSSLSVKKQRVKRTLPKEDV